MKKGKLTLGIVLGLLIIGFVVAQAQAVSAQDESSAAVEPFTLRAGGCFCMDKVPYCNDVLVAYQSVGCGQYSLTGYEYGCGYEDRIVFGAMRVEGNTLQIAYTTICGLTCGLPSINQCNAQIDLGTTPPSGPYQFAVHSDGYNYGAGTMQLIACPVSAVASTGPDEMEE